MGVAIHVANVEGVHRGHMGHQPDLEHASGAPLCGTIAAPRLRSGQFLVWRPIEGLQRLRRACALRPHGSPLQTTRKPISQLEARTSPTPKMAISSCPKACPVHSKYELEAKRGVPSPLIRTALYVPRNSGRRFSRKAATPSLASRVGTIRAKAASSIASPSSIAASIPR
jgi:hypothetical protein